MLTLKVTETEKTYHARFFFCFCFFVFCVAYAALYVFAFCLPGYSPW